MAKTGSGVIFMFRHHYTMLVDMYMYVRRLMEGNTASIAVEQLETSRQQVNTENEMWHDRNSAWRTVTLKLK